jgi:hypothetical protein
LKEYLNFITLAIICCISGILVLAVLIGSFRFPKLVISQKTIFFFLIGSLILDVITKSYLLLNLGTSIHLFSFLSLLEFLFFSTFYLQVINLEDSKKKTLRIIQISGIVIIVGFILKTLQTTELSTVATISSNLKIAVSLVLIILALHLMIDQITQEKSRVVIFGILIYFASSIIIFLLLPKLITIKLVNSYLIWLINSLLLFGFYLVCFLDISRWSKS